MTREEKLKVLGAKSLEWKHDGLLGMECYDAVSLNPYTQEELEYKIEIKEMSTKGYHISIKLISRSGTLLLGETLSDNYISPDVLKEMAEQDFYNRIVNSAKEVGITAPDFEEKEAEEHHTPSQAKSLLSEVTPLKWYGEESTSKCSLSSEIVLIDEDDEDEDNALIIDFRINVDNDSKYSSLDVHVTGKWEIGYYDVIETRGYAVPLEELKAKAEEVRLSMAKRLLGIKE
jgi:hypothetical protein|nr:MAG TPA: hypothetical protein [Bacteriophage sp.]